MKILYIVTLLLFIVSGCRRDGDGGATDDLRRNLDQLIASEDKYVQIKENRLDSLRRLLSRPQDPRKRYETVNLLINEYEAYKADSALHYINLNLESPIAESDSLTHMRLLLKKADLYSHAGLFSDAKGIMESIDASSLPDADREQYFANYCSLYQYMVEYNTDFDAGLEHEYEQCRRQYVDSIRNVSDTLSFIYTIYVIPQIEGDGDAAKAISRLRDALGAYPEGSREYSILASILAYVYKVNGDRDDYKEYLTRSAISDLKGAVKENMSFREMATNMYDDGDIDGANIYLKKSIADANFFSARMRNAQSLRILPTVDGAYATRQRQLYQRLEWMVAIISLLSLGLVGTLFYIRRQYTRLKSANAEVARYNEELSRVSEQLRIANTDLEDKNRVLNESNVIKEQYTALFMEYCATAINALQRYHQSLRLMANQGISKSILLKKLESSEFIDSTIKEFYSRFDEAILKIYPDFPEKVNALLKADEQVKLKPGEILNTELRIQALIRIGISENAKIAEFLRCSITTIYTYRSKLRRRALDPDTFETDILRIS
ncbi:hypothetical protein HDR69_02605 [bacterium]|nr:hypothetical protein [bacterium]